MKNINQKTQNQNFTSSHEINEWTGTKHRYCNKWKYIGRRAETFIQLIKNDQHKPKFIFSFSSGHVGWGISWYINGLLIPEINVVRGKKYTFIVEGGENPDVPARYHPFYITDDSIGGYQHKTAEEKAVRKLSLLLFIKLMRYDTMWCDTTAILLAKLLQKYRTYSKNVTSLAPTISYHWTVDLHAN